MTAEQFELMKTAARTLLAHRDAGRHCDPHGLLWAENLLRQNPHATPDTPFDDVCMTSLTDSRGTA